MHSTCVNLIIIVFIINNIISFPEIKKVSFVNQIDFFLRFSNAVDAE